MTSNQRTRWYRRHPILHFSMAIRAYEDALLCLLPQALQRQRDALGADRQPLGTRIDVMEVQCPHVPAVSAYAAGPTGLFDENRLHLPSTPGHRVRSAPPAPIAATCIEVEDGLSMTRTAHLQSAQAGTTGSPGSLRGPASGTAGGPQTMLRQPMPDRRLTAPNRRPNLSDRGTRGHQRLQLFLG
jgi:hypothetical protein